MKLKYTDELILQKREAKKKQFYSSLEKGIYINHAIVTFTRCVILDLFSIMMTDDFKLMPEELAQIKYPSVFRPQCIYTNSALSVNIGFSTFPDNIKTKDFDTLTGKIIKTLHMQNSDYLFNDQAAMEVIQGNWFDFRSSALDSDIFNMMLLAPMDKTIIQSSFNCPYKEYSIWKPVVIQMWESILSERKIESESSLFKNGTV